MQLYSYKDRVSYTYALIVPFYQKNYVHAEIVEKYLSKYKSELLIIYVDTVAPRTPVNTIKSELNKVHKILEHYSIPTVFIGEKSYFNVFRGKPSTATVMDTLGEKCPPIMGERDLYYLPNLSIALQNPEQITKDYVYVFKKHFESAYPPIVKIPAYLADFQESVNFIRWLKTINTPIAIDIETYDLKFHKAELASIGFSFADGVAVSIGLTTHWHTQGQIIRLKEELLSFFKDTSMPFIFHNATFDVSALIRQLYMRNHSDQRGLLNGLEIFGDIHPVEDTMLMAYEKYNVTNHANIGLKDLSLHFIGDYGLGEEALTDVKAFLDDSEDNLSKLLVYNSLDCIATYRLYEEYRNLSFPAYRSVFQPAIQSIVQTQLSGMPIDLHKVLHLFDELNTIADSAYKDIQENIYTVITKSALRQDKYEKKQAKLKKKIITIEDIPEEPFNINSSPQMQYLLYDENTLNLPVINLTKKDNPSVDADTLSLLKDNITHPSKHELLEHLHEYKGTQSILNTFLPAFKEAIPTWDSYYLCGNFRLGGPLSGRLSSNNPNMQNLPNTGTKYGKAVKECFISTKKWLLVGVDYDSLEDKISALQTKDTNKLAVYLDNYDGHSLRAYKYFSKHMPDIDPTSVDSINSIKYKYPQLRQDSKPITFALTYFGTYKTIYKNTDLSIEDSIFAADAYAKLYSESIEYVYSIMDGAINNGYAVLAFGLKLRCPNLHKLKGTNYTRKEVTLNPDFRTVANALTQSYGMLNTRANNEVMATVRKSKFKYEIKPASQVHDSQYFLCRNKPETMYFLNNTIQKAIRWQELPEIAHDEVKLSGQTEIFYPNLTCPIEIGTSASLEEVTEILAKIK